MTFEEITKDKCFITDMRENKAYYDMATGITQNLGRFAVWSPLKDQEGHTVIEVGNDIKVLQQKYAVEDELILTVCNPKDAQLKSNVNTLPFDP